MTSRRLFPTACRSHPLGRSLAWLGVGLACSVSVWAQNDPATTLPGGGLRWQRDQVQVVLGLDVNVYAYQMKGTWWGLPAGLGTTGFTPERSFAELWVQPRLNVESPTGGGGRWYGGLSLGLTQDVGENAFALRNEGHAEIENAYLGWKGPVGAGEAEISVGSQPFSLGTGMLVYAGSSNGGEWGNAASAKRLAWERSVVARYRQSGWTAQAFWLDPNELPSTESGTRLAGASLEWQGSPSQRAGLAWLHVPKSNFFYPGDLAPLVYLQGARDGLNMAHGWLDWQDPAGLSKNLGVRAEFVLQNGEVTRLGGQVDDLRAQAAYLGTSYWFQTLPFAPKLSYGYAYFSGDDRNTSRYERFDPLFWGNGLDNWWFGANGSYAFINSNVRFQRFTLDGYLSAQDIFKVQYVRSYAAELNSPLQFGQGVRFSPGFNPVVGVASAHLSNEWMVQYLHVFKPSLVFSAYVSRSSPGEGLRQITGAQSQAWNTLGMGVFYQY